MIFQNNDSNYHHYRYLPEQIVVGEIYKPIKDIYIYIDIPDSVPKKHKINVGKTVKQTIKSPSNHNK